MRALSLGISGDGDERFAGERERVDGEERSLGLARSYIAARVGEGEMDGRPSR